MLHKSIPDYELSKCREGYGYRLNTRGDIYPEYSIQLIIGILKTLKSGNATDHFQKDTTYAPAKHRHMYYLTAVSNHTQAKLKDALISESLW